ncbi:diguanylate cyclase domain-containing protein [Hymenobacter aquaticus]|uniref:diguanylate cyclase domain-containing protein n=1 Tax=Hymenobacter aquaticus TaxID=1867101 RepID=UPI001436A1E9|nr:diguanylate cyclase [Hymenobacter aquaticus]
MTEYDKIKKFFFPENQVISLPLYLFSIAAIGSVICYVMYSLYYREKEKHAKTKTDLINIKSLLLDSERLRLIDFVTGIPNQVKFKIDMENRPKELFHLILIDLDKFGVINKKRGFQKGDDIIRIIAQDLFIKMRRDEEMYKLSYKMEESFVKRVYRKYTGGDEFIFLIKGPQYEAVGFITRVQKQLSQLSKREDVLELDYKIQFHAAIVPLYPNDTYDLAYDKLQRAYVQAAEEKDGMRVFWDSRVELDYYKSHSFIYDNARKEFLVNS